MDQCPNCGVDREAPGIACPACGHSFADSAPTSAPPTSQPTSDAPTSGPIGAASGVSAEPLHTGSVLGGRYRLDGLLGRGGMGEVYKAQDLKLGQVVALKFLPATVANNASAMQRFLSEMRLGRQVSHPNVCRLHDLVEIEGRYALSMEFIDGEDLATRIARAGPLDAKELSVLASDLCAGLAAAHDRGVVHRDMKPANVLLDRAGHAHIADFGIAALSADTDVREMAGTLAYMAPELLSGGSASVRSDLYSVGLVLYEAAKGRRRYSARSLEELKAQHATPDDKARVRLGGAPPGVRRLVAACLRPTPETRPPSAQAAGDLLRNESWLPKPRQLAMAAVVLLAVLAAVGWLGLKRGWIAAGPQLAGAPARLGPDSAAVLPFANLSGEKRDEYFSDGMSDTLIDRLSQVPQLRIAARTSSFSFKGKAATVQEIGAALGVVALVEGSVQRDGDTLRISAELIRVADGARLWSQAYDRKAKDLFAIQDEIASSVTTALVGKLLPSSKAALAKHGTDDLEAYQDYIQGHQAMNRVSMDSFKRAEQFLRAALQRDPHYVAAMLDLAQCYGWQSGLGAYGPDEFQRRAGPLLDRVEALDPGNPRVIALRGWLAQTRGEMDLAIKLVDRAVALAPDDYGIRINAAGAYANNNDLAGALRHQDRMVALDPLNPFGHSQRAMSLEFLDRKVEARAAAWRALKLDPDDLTAMAVMADLALDDHDRVGALIWALKIYPHNRDPGVAVNMAINLDSIGETKAADAWMAEARRLQPENNIIADGYDITRHYLRGKDDAAIAATRVFLEDKQNHWGPNLDVAIENGCMAASRAGKLPELRAMLVRAGKLPADFTVGGLQAWAATGDDRRKKIEGLQAQGACAFTAADSDAARRDALRQALDSLPRPKAGQEDAMLDARLRNDRAAVAENFAKWSPNASWLERAEADLLGISDVPRVQAKIRQSVADEAKAKADLPAVLAKEKLSIFPPAKSTATTAP